MYLNILDERWKYMYLCIKTSWITFIDIFRELNEESVEFCAINEIHEQQKYQDYEINRILVFC